VRALRLKSETTKNKFGAERATVDGIKFDSKIEARRYGELKLLERAHQIQNLRIHPVFEIVFPRHEPSLNEKNFSVTYIPICKVELDFSYIDKRDGRWHHEDVKGKDTPMSKLKRKLVEAAHGIKVEIIK
jgi:hypothetical protein